MPYQCRGDTASQKSDDNGFLSCLELAVELMVSNRFMAIGDTDEVDTYGSPKRRRS